MIMQKEKESENKSVGESADDDACRASHESSSVTTIQQRQETSPVDTSDVEEE